MACIHTTCHVLAIQAYVLQTRPEHAESRTPSEYVSISILSIELPTSIKQQLTMPSFRRFFHPSSPSVNDDLAHLEECFRDSSFALVPSALTPSRAPSNSIIAATRALFFDRPVRLDFTSGLEKGPVRNWYNKQRAEGSTAIKKIQLRKDYQHPYYHEYIIISTRNGHTYRIDRRPDPDTPFDTIMKAGCVAYDTIQELDSTSFNELDSTSSCVVELFWQGEETVDLLFILSICFAIHNDKSTDRYTLQCHNCYFLSWAIIGITVRKIAVRGVVFNRMEQGQGQVLALALMLDRDHRELEWVLDQVLERVLARVPERVLARVPTWVGELVQELARELERMLARELELELARERELELELAQMLEKWELEWQERRQGRRQQLELEQELERKLGHKLEKQELGHRLGMERELGHDLRRELRRRLELKQAEVLVLVRELAMLELGLKLELELELELKRVLERQPELELERARGQEWAHGLGQIPLVLGPMKNFALAKTVPSRQVHFIVLFLHHHLIYSNIA